MGGAHLEGFMGSWWVILCLIFICLGFCFLAFHLYPPPPNHLHWPSFPYFTCDEKMELNLGKIFKGMLELGLGCCWPSNYPKTLVPIFTKYPNMISRQMVGFCVDLSPSLVGAGLAFLWFPSCNQNICIYIYIYLSLSLYIYIYIYIYIHNGCRY